MNESTPTPTNEQPANFIELLRAIRETKSAIELTYKELEVCRLHGLADEERERLDHRLPELKARYLQLDTEINERFPVSAHVRFGGKEADRE